MQWRLHGLTLMVVSVLATPYAWFTDEVVLLPAVVQVALWAYNARERFTWKKTGASGSPTSTHCRC
jgi:N6-adenosine-specific RNA methylase IME4